MCTARQGWRRQIEKHFSQLMVLNHNLDIFAVPCLSLKWACACCGILLFMFVSQMFGFYFVSCRRRRRSRRSWRGWSECGTCTSVSWRGSTMRTTLSMISSHVPPLLRSPLMCRSCVCSCATQTVPHPVQIQRSSYAKWPIPASPFTGKGWFQWSL